MLNDAETKNLLNRHFDLVILDGAFPECAVSLVHAFRAPFMLINTVGLYTGSLSLAGNPAPYSTTPIFFSSFTDEMNLYQRFLNTMYTIFAFSVHRVRDVMGWFISVSSSSYFFAFRSMWPRIRTERQSQKKTNQQPATPSSHTHTYAHIHAQTLNTYTDAHFCIPLHPVTFIFKSNRLSITFDKILEKLFENDVNVIFLLHINSVHFSTFSA